VKRWALAALVFCGCTEKDLSAPIGGAHPPAKRYAPPAGLPRVRMSITPFLDPEYLQKAYQPLTRHLSVALGVPVEMVVAPNYDELGAQLARKEVDLGVFSPFAYVRARAVSPDLEPVVNFISDGSASAAGYIVVKADSAYHSLEDLKGHSMAFVDPASTSGFLYPTKMLLDRGLDPHTFFSKVDFLGNHEAALLAVYEGRDDSGATYQGALPALQRQKGISPLSFRIVAKTARTPRDIICARPGLPPELIAEVRRLLLALDARSQAGRDILQPINANGFLPPDDRLYDPVREAYAAVTDGGRP
jgi:phosphonate transport system substrate-binding protein